MEGPARSPPLTSSSSCRSRAFASCEKPRCSRCCNAPVRRLPLWLPASGRRAAWQDRWPGFWRQGRTWGRHQKKNKLPINEIDRDACTSSGIFVYHRGRPKAAAACKPKSLKYALKITSGLGGKAVARAREEVGCFVLRSNNAREVRA
jgi:hypothetical protein